MLKIPSRQKEPLHSLGSWTQVTYSGVLQLEQQDDFIKWCQIVKYMPGIKVLGKIMGLTESFM